MNTCETCKHWKTLDAGIGHGACRRIDWENDNGFEVQTDGPVAIVIASIDCGAEVDAVLMTLPTFGCTEWKREELASDVPWTVYEAQGMALTFAFLGRFVPVGVRGVICGRPKIIRMCTNLFVMATNVPDSLRWWTGVEFEIDETVNDGTLVFASAARGLGESFEDWRFRCWHTEIRGIGV